MLAATKARVRDGGREAARHAEQTSAASGAVAGTPLFLGGIAGDSGTRGIAIHRTCDGCAAGHPCQECAEKEKALQPSGVRAKLSISQPGDEAEIEADRVADQVMRMPVSVSEQPERGLLRSAAPATPASQSAGPFAVPSTASGRPLSADARQFFEPRFGWDLGGVRIHDDSAAAASARSIHARAYTYGNQVVFGAGQFAPDQAAGRRLLAHELTHVLQQQSGRARISRAPGGTLPRFMRQAATDAGTTDAATAGAGVPDAGAAPTDAGVPGGVPAPPAPTGPDACATTEEEERKTRFRGQSLSALNFRPPTAGFGKFDAFYWPAASLMAAIVKMKFNYVQADNTPDVATLWSMWLAGDDITQFFWTQTQKTQFAEEYRNRVVERWSFAHTFRSTKPCWPFTAMPYVAPRIV